MRRILQHAVITVMQRQIVGYVCDGCGAVCGTRANPKQTWTSRDGETHYCKRTAGDCRKLKREKGKAAAEEQAEKEKQ
jgi:hypothetical protein